MTDTAKVLLALVGFFLIMPGNDPVKKRYRRYKRKRKYKK